MPPTPKWTKVAGPFLARLASCAEEERIAEVMNTPSDILGYSPFSIGNPSSQLSCSSSSSSLHRKNAARKTTSENWSHHHHHHQQQQQQQQQQQPSVPPAPSPHAFPSFPVHTAKQTMQQQTKLAAACTTLSLDTFLSPHLTVRAPRPRYVKGPHLA